MKLTPSLKEFMKLKQKKPTKKQEETKNNKNMMID